MTLTPVVVYPHVEFIEFSVGEGPQLSHSVIGPTVATPVIEGTRVPVSRLWMWHKRGTTCDTLFLRYPQLSRASILSALAFAYDNAEIIESDLKRRESAVGPR